MANDGLLWVFDLAPGTIVADDGDNGQFLAHHAFELHAVESKSAIAVYDQYFFAWTGNLGSHGEARTCTEAAHWTGIEPVAGFVDIDDSSGITDDIAAIPDY